MIVDVMRKADDENEIYCLLTAYIDAARFCYKGNFLPEHVMRLPVNDVHGVRSRFNSLIAGLDAASKGLDDSARVVLREALHVFGTAVACLLKVARNDARRPRRADARAA